MAILYAECWVGEFGWELFCWQGYLRKLSRKYDETFVACRHGHEPLYQDFATTVSEDVASEDCDMWQCKGYKHRPFEEIFKRSMRKQDRFISTRSPVLRYDHTHKLNKDPLFARFKDQEFVQLGEKRAGGYDVVIHARRKTNKVNAGMSSNYRNWSPQKWEHLTQKFKGLRIAHIGTRKGALQAIGDDLRGVNLKLVSNVLASSKVLISASSGPVHLAALCGCPTVTWFGDPYDESNKNRFLKDWNPFETPVTVKYVPDWQPSAKWVSENMKQYL